MSPAVVAAAIIVQLLQIIYVIKLHTIEQKSKHQSLLMRHVLAPENVISL